ncbi:MAG TPA: DeoR/GlpR family DNA-binding transcription regulator [Phycisphaerae bacterium]|nr:DeoR/GlpR family DNA-binding transcription regulator [Phycisphaerae bacterium]
MAGENEITDRRAKAAEMLSIQGFMPLSELCRLLGVSESTVRRDLEVLEEQGLIKRTYGGAVYVKDTSPHKLAFAERETTALDEKQAIARTVAGLIPENQTIILNGGTTCREVARALAGRRLSVVTNSVPVASLLSAALATEVTLVGGYVYPRTGVCLGSMTVEQLQRVHATQLVMSCAGVTQEGAFNANQMMIDVERRMMGMADQVILAADHTKLGMRSVVKLCGLDEVDVVVTDAGADPASRAWLEAQAARVIYAERENADLTERT